MLTAEYTAESAAAAMPTMPSRTTLIVLTIVVLAALFCCIDYLSADVSTLDDFAATADEIVDRTTEGDAVRRVAILGIGLFGTVLLLRRDGFRLNLQPRLAWPPLAYIGWCALSVLWSDNPSSTVRHFIALFLCSVGVLGIARQFGLRDLCVIALALTTIMVANSVRVELALGTFHPVSADYRFAGTLHPNCQAPFCATMALAAFFLARHSQRGRWFLWMLCVAGVIMLLLTKSRTTCGAYLAGLVFYGALNVSWRTRIMCATAVVAIGFGVVLASTLVESGFQQQVVGVALIGRQDEADSLTGRVPLWTSLLPHVQDHFLLGHGYIAFWTPERIDVVSQMQGWPVPDAHSVYLDTILSLGLVGLGLYMTALGVGMREALRRFRRDGDYGAAFLLTSLGSRVLAGMLESSYVSPVGAVPFILVCGLAHLAFYERPEEPEAVSLRGTRQAEESERSLGGALR